MVLVAAGRDQRPDAGDRRRGVVWHAQPVPERPHHVLLQRLEGVDEDTMGVRHPGSHAYDALARLAVVHQPLWQVRDSERRKRRRMGKEVNSSKQINARVS